MPAGVRKVQLGRAVFALTSTAFLVAVALDVDAGTYKTLPYLGLNVVIALIALLLTTRRPSTGSPGCWRARRLGEVGGVFYGYAVEALVTDPGSLPGGLVAAWFDNWWWLPGLVLPLCAASADARRPPGVAPMVARPGRRGRRDGPRLGRGLGLADIRPRTATPIENPLARDGGTAIVVAGIAA